MVQYCFVNQNMPLFNAVPYHLMLTENEERQRRKMSAQVEEYGSNSGSGQIVAWGRKKRKLVLKKDKRCKTARAGNRLLMKKKLKSLHKWMKHINKRIMKDAFDSLKEPMQTSFQNLSFNGQYWENVRLGEINGSEFYNK